MARFRLTQSIYVDGAAVGHLRAGRIICDSQANALPGDVVWVGLNAQSLPAGSVPLDSSASAMLTGSRWANSPLSATILGVDSIG